MPGGTRARGGGGGPQLRAHVRLAQPAREDGQARRAHPGEACKLGAYKPAYRTSDARRHLRAQLAVRDALVPTRTRYISLMRALVRREGFHVGSGSAEAFGERLVAMELPAHLQAEVAPLLALMEALNQQIAALNETLERVASQDV